MTDDQAAPHGPQPTTTGRQATTPPADATSETRIARARGALLEDGVALLRDAVSFDVLEVLRNAVAANRATDQPMSRQVLYTHTPPPPGRPPLSAIMDQWLNPFLYRGTRCTRPAAEELRPLVRDLLLAPPVLFQDLLLVKREGQGPFPWHQDFGFWPVDRPAGLVIWVPLQAANGESGALEFAAGSHRLGPRPVVDLHTGRPQRDEDLGFDPDDWLRLAPTYAPGDAVVFTPTTFHASPAMRRAGERAAWSCVYLSPHARWRHANAPNHPITERIVDGALVSEAHHA